MAIAKSLYAAPQGLDSLMEEDDIPMLEPDELPSFRRKREYY
jgi:hypothetical protein